MIDRLSISWKIWSCLIIIPFCNLRRNNLFIVDGYPVGYIERLISGVSGTRDIFIDSLGYMYLSSSTVLVYKASANVGATSIIAGGGSVTTGNNIPSTLQRWVPWKEYAEIALVIYSGRIVQII